MKKLSVLAYSLMIGLSAFATGRIDINERLLRSFKERFPRAQEVRWIELPDAYEVNFTEDGVRTNIIYDKDGAFLRSTRYYQEQSLPYYLLTTIKKRYADQKIFAVTEVSNATGIEYYVKMEDTKIWMTIRIDGEGNLGVVEKFRKA